MSKILPVIVAPHKLLLQTSAPVKAVDDSIRATLDDMLDTLYAADGVGLAAPQVGILQRLVMVDLGTERPDGKRDYSKPKPQAFINPEITWKSTELRYHQEGCLSIPGIYADVERADRVKVKWLDRDGAPHEAEFDGLRATVLQHEIDHLDGVLFLKRLSRLQRERMEKKYSKLLPDFLDHAKYAVSVEGRGVIDACAHDHSHDHGHGHVHGPHCNHDH
ncbi:MAG TPA: peptide deformylase [Alphaproteobacteria bacterium]|nr:peptide deformylase [Alphaproteobacteria bacterium]